MIEERKLELFQYRIGFLIGGTAYPFFGWFSEYYLKVNFDSLLLRAPVAVYCLAFLFLSFKSNYIERNLRYFVLFACCWAMYDYINYFALSNYHYYFSIGLTAMPFLIFIILFQPIDMIIFFVFSLVSGAFILSDSNIVFILTYLILTIMAFSVYLLVTRSRSLLLSRLRDNIELLKNQQSQINEKNQSLIKIGELATQVAHDIRSPVTALQAVTEMFTDDMDPKQKRLIENVATRINNIANNLVDAYRDNLTNDLSSIKIGRNISLNSLIEEIVEEKKLALDQKNQIVVSAAESINVPDYLDVTEFQRILSNLINNSLEAIESGGKVAIDLRRSGAHISLTIHDNGKGITPEMQHQLFKKGTTSKPKGAGLGLAHAKEYLDSIASKISIDSIAGKGTTVIIELRS